LRRIFGPLGTAGLVALLGLASWLGWQLWRSRTQPTTPGDPSLGPTSPYRNVQAGVKYVGDEVCASCHVEIADTYRQHPMGRDLAPLRDAARLERLDVKAHNPFTALGFQFHVERRDGRMVHQVAAQDAAGRTVARREQEVQYVIGSGTRTYSYLIERDGYLWESPITWFPQAQLWDLSPGFGRPYLDGRPVSERCLFCHCNHADHVPGTENRYRPPIFSGYAIGCERCHGPGELHVASRAAGQEVGDFDDTIVNPARLQPALRESVCQQCHLEGSNRIWRRGREPFDYRPGLPLHEFLSVFVPAPEFGQTPQFVGQVEQMVASRCYQASNGQLGCISCHDPHAVPRNRMTHFRDCCLKCHQETSCALTPATRRQSQSQDSCIACHMPRHGTGDIPHTAVTDHHIPRNPKVRAPAAAGEFRLGGMPLVPFHRGLVDEQDPEVGRDLGIALMELAWSSPPMGQQASALAVPLLDEAVRRWPDDAPAWEARGKVRWQQGRQREGLADLETALELAPREESILEAAATMATALRDEDRARAYWERLIAINPWKAMYHLNLAQLRARRQEWPQVRAECQAVLRGDPFNAEARLLLVRCLLQAGDKEQARTELDTAAALQPARAAEWRRWFAEQTR
jgi:Flp pilus assembly protein TadD